MTFEMSLQELGLAAPASPTQIERAYKTRSRALKTLILGSTRIELKEQHRDELRRLVVSRAIALGRTPPRDWHAERFRISSSRLLKRLKSVESFGMTRERALAFFGLPKDVERERVERIYRAQQRALIKRFVRATDDVELDAIRRARRKLRTIRNFAA
ncbi:MAG: hypothetical protein ACYTGN_01100 [Planctomycetota bacterium]|jgi:hypothetical protein